jgi:hypothetical protein
VVEQSFQLGFIINGDCYDPYNELPFMLASFFDGSFNNPNHNNNINVNIDICTS